MWNKSAYLNFGLTFNQFSLFYIPIWNYGDVEYALYSEDLQTIYTIDDADVEYFESEYNIPIVKEPTLSNLSAWNRYGGKVTLVVVLLAVFLYFGCRHNQKEKEEQEELARQALEQ